MIQRLWIFVISNLEIYLLFVAWYLELSAPSGQMRPVASKGETLTTRRYLKILYKSHFVKYALHENYLKSHLPEMLRITKQAGISNRKPIYFYCSSPSSSLRINFIRH